MSLRNTISAVLDGYLTAKSEQFTQHPMAHFLRHDLRDAIADAADRDDLIFKGSAGMSTWAAGPWAAVFNPIVTDSAQRGYYVVYLFREDMEGVYLSLNQGMTEAKSLYKADAKTALRGRAANFRAMLGPQTAAFPVLEIDLAPASPANDTAFYEAGNVCAVFYRKSQLPSDEVLHRDLRQMVAIYSHLIDGETASGESLSIDLDAPPDLHVEDATRFRLHKRIERNAKLSKEVKKRKGCTCEVCNLTFSERYGPLGADYIEAHHLKPLASIKGQQVTMDPVKDFAVLCANCHRMVHRSGYLDDIARFKREHFHG